MDRLKIGMWFLFIAGIALPGFYILTIEKLPPDFEISARVSKENMWKQAILPLPADMPIDSELASIGKLLWFDPKITKNKNGACETCHKLANSRPDVCFEVPSANCDSCHPSPTNGSGGDGLAMYDRFDSKKGDRNTLSVWNSIFNVGYGWEARELELPVFIRSHIADQNISGISEERLISAINENETYRKFFESKDGGAVSAQAVSLALAEFTKTLVASNSRFDRYILGDKNALSPQEKRGYETFRKRGCVICHNGINIGGNSFKTFGVYKLHKLQDKIGWYELLGSSFESENLRRKDTGASRLTGEPIDNYLFRVASLRNVEINKPYFTNGQVWSLEEAIRTMGRVQLNAELGETEIQDIRAFLGSLSGVIPVITPPKRGEQ